MLEASAGFLVIHKLSSSKINTGLLMFIEREIQFENLDKK